MATLKEIKGRISAVQNTKKITKTMEMVATAKSKRAVDRVNQSIVYSEKMKKLTQSIASASSGFAHSLLRVSESIKKVGLLVVTGNRGLCGGFNNYVIKMTQQRIKELKSQEIECELHLVGKKVINSFKFLNIPFDQSFTHIEDKPSYEEACEFANYFIDQFEKQTIDRFEVISTKYINSAVQKAEITQLLPFEIEQQESEEDSKDGHKTEQVNFLFEPSAREILSSLLPRSIRVVVFQALLESAASEQIARRIAMKNATENATDIIRDLTLAYNRVRQGKITQEIAELAGGAAAIQ